MSLQLSTSVRNARLDQVETTVGTAPLLKIYSGADPANCAAADPTGLLATITLPSDWMAAAASGSKAMLGSWTNTASGAGTAASFRIKDSTNTTCHLQGSVTATGGGVYLLQVQIVYPAGPRSVTIGNIIVDDKE